MTLIYDRSTELRAPPKMVAALPHGQKNRLEVPTILPGPHRPKDAKSVEKPGRGIILVALEFFSHISWLLTPALFYMYSNDSMIRFKAVLLLDV